MTNYEALKLHAIITACVANEVRIRNRDDGYAESGRRVADEVLRRLNEAQMIKEVRR